MQYPPTIYAHLQTDGSYKSHKIAKIGFYLKTINGDIHTSSYKITAQSSIETEWASILGGIEFSEEYNQECVFVENDCLSIISFFSPHAKKLPPLGTPARYYYDEICRVSNEFGYVGLRWIPRELNKADQVLR